MRRIIIIFFAVIATMLSFNQKANAQKQVKVPVFEGVITAKKGTVNIRKEASTQSEKIGKIYANINFYPLLDQDEEWYRILLPESDEENIQEKNGQVTYGYVAKAFCKMAPINENTTSPSNFQYYLENKIRCKNTIRKQGDYKQNFIVSGTFAKWYNEVGYCFERMEGRFIGVPHKGVMVGEFINSKKIHFNMLVNGLDWEKSDAIYGEMSTDFYDPSAPTNVILTDEQIAKSTKFAHKAIMYAVPSSYNNEIDCEGYDNKGIEIMYVDMDKYPFKYETIQFNDDESFSYFVVDNEEKP